MSSSIKRRKLVRGAKYVAFVAVALLLVSLRDISAISSDGVKFTVQPFGYGRVETQRLACSSRNRHGVPVYDTKEKVIPPTFMGGFSSSGQDYWENSSRIDGAASLAVTREHPRLFATRDRWMALNGLIHRDAYLATWDEKIRRRADGLYYAAPINYTIDGSLAGSGVLDVAREFQLRIKTWAYAYRLSRHVKWKDRIWEELLVASGNSTQYFGIHGDNWNSEHWLDVGEFLVAFAIAYDWLFEAWSDRERTAIVWSMISLGLQKGLEAYQSGAWFLSARGNWNCVTNGGMIVGALAIFHDDPTRTAEKILHQAVENARDYCAQAVETDGTWAETPDYWYFGTQAHAQMSSALLTATGSTHGMLVANSAFRHTPIFHMYNWGMTQKFNYGDCGPSKITATANALFFYGSRYRNATFILYQRDRPDAADPLAMLWYDADVAGSWFHKLSLDKSFPDVRGAWVSMRSSWRDPNGLFVAMKAGKMTGHASHGNIDAGDFVLDALGERWAGELCQDNYLSDGYFSGEAQDTTRWLYYRCRTEGQNTLLYNGSNQIVDAEPKTRFGSSGDISRLASSSFWIANLTAAYGGLSVARGLRLLHGRRTVLIQDEIGSSSWGSQWRMHTNASIQYSDDARIAHLQLNGKSMTVSLQSPPEASFRTLLPAPLSYDPKHSSLVENLANPGVSVLGIDIPPGNSIVAVVFSPGWEPGWTAELPKLKALDRWSPTSHDV